MRFRLFKRGRLAVVSVMVTLFVLSSCSGGSSYTDLDHEAYEGLPTAVVQERLNDPAFKAILEGSFSAEDQPWTVQSNVLIHLLCRDAYSAYEDWIYSGIRPEEVTIVVPTVPGPRFEYTPKYYANDLNGAINSGDASQLRDVLKSEGRCRDLVADPEVSLTVTIGDLVV